VVVVVLEAGMAPGPEVTVVVELAFGGATIGSVVVVVVERETGVPFWSVVVVELELEVAGCALRVVVAASDTRAAIRRLGARNVFMKRSFLGVVTSYAPIITPLGVRML
jgi:hypothetical protein